MKSVLVSGLVAAAAAVSGIFACADTSCPDACDKLKTCNMVTNTNSYGINCNAGCSQEPSNPQTDLARTQADIKCASCVNSTPCDKIATECASSCPAGAFN